MIISQAHYPKLFLSYCVVSNEHLGSVSLHHTSRVSLRLVIISVSLRSSDSLALSTPSMPCWYHWICNNFRESSLRDWGLQVLVSDTREDCLVFLRTLKGTESLWEVLGSSEDLRGESSHHLPFLVTDPLGEAHKAYKSSIQTHKCSNVPTFVYSFRGVKEQFKFRFKTLAPSRQLVHWQKAWPCLSSTVWGAVKKKGWVTAVEDNTGETRGPLQVPSRLLIFNAEIPPLLQSLSSLSCPAQGWHLICSFSWGLDGRLGLDLGTRSRDQAFAMPLWISPAIHSVFRLESHLLPLWSFRVLSPRSEWSLDFFLAAHL